MSWYCDSAPGDPYHAPYHDHEYGFPLSDDAQLLERLALEIFQAGLSWLIVLKKRPAIVAAFEGFDPATVAAYGEAERQRLLSDGGLIRNRLKIEAIIENARRVVAFGPSHGDFAGWLAAHHPLTLAQWTKLFRKTFKFTGGEITNEFLMSIGYLPTPHRRDCPVYGRILALNPPWLSVGEAFYVDPS